MRRVGDRWRSRGWHKCPRCGCMIPPGEDYCGGLCSVCYQFTREGSR